MSILQELQDIKYRMVLDLVKKEEPYDKKRNVVSGEEAFLMLHERYESLQNLLEPLKKSLGDNIKFVDISFNNNLEAENNLLIKYLNGYKRCFLGINYIDDGQIDVMLSDISINEEDFLKENYLFLQYVLYKLDDYYINNSSEVIRESTSKKFFIRDNFSIFNIRDQGRKLFSIETSHFQYDKDGLKANRETLSEYRKLRELLLDSDNIQKIYEHLRIYEDKFPDKILKKIR